MKLQFGKADHGWLPTTLELEDRTLAFDVSYLPYDFVGELTRALLGVLTAPGEYVARICEEPTEHLWRFRSSDPSAVVFEVVTCLGRRSDRGEVTAELRGPPLDIVLPLWRGLQELQSRARREGYNSHWSRPFPFDALAQLTEGVEKARAPLHHRT